MDLSSQYLGLELKNPFVPSSSPLSKNLDTARQLEDHGASAIVMHSLFQEEIEEDNAPAYGGTAGSHLVAAPASLTSKEEYLEQFKRLKDALDIPIIPSLNGSSSGNWVGYAAELEAAGAKALELNVYYVAADLTESADSVEQRVISTLRAVKSQIGIPIGIKLSPFYSSLGHLVASLEASGADGVSLFSRFYQPNIDLENLGMSSALELSTSGDALLAMRWIAILKDRVSLSLAATGGIHFAEDVLKMLLCGADVTYLSSTLLANGPKQLTRIQEGTARWLREHDYESISQIKGLMSQANSSDPASFERGHYMKLLNCYKIK
jgi:dihydroorotate dehydrogenase (fumarate)